MKVGAKIAEEGGHEIGGMLNWKQGEKKLIYQLIYITVAKNMEWGKG